MDDGRKRFLIGFVPLSQYRGTKKTPIDKSDLVTTATTTAIHIIEGEGERRQQCCSIRQATLFCTIT